MSKIARTLGAVAIVAAPFVMMSAPAAYATGGCTVDNASTTTHGSVSVTVPPGSVAAQSSSVSCSYVSGGGTVYWSCTLLGGRCDVTRSGATGSAAFCTAYAGITCGGEFQAEPGQTITLTVYGGSGSVSDAV